MRNLCKRILALLLVLALMAGLTACSGIGFDISETGYITWRPISNAVKYECAMVDQAYTNDGFFFLTEPGYQLKPGYSLHVRPVFADGSVGEWHNSDFYGEGIIDSAAETEFTESTVPTDASEDPLLSQYLDPNYDVTWEQLECFELISAIRWDTVYYGEDGLLRFEADGPHGVMRFEGLGVTAENGELTFQPGAQIWGLDAIGRICAISPTASVPGDSNNFYHFSGGYTFTQSTSVEKHEDLMYIWGLGTLVTNPYTEFTVVTLMDWQPNFVIIGTSNHNVDAVSISALNIYYDTATFTSGIRYMGLNTDFYGLYLSGERYDPSREVYDLNANILTFYLTAVPDLRNEIVYYEGGPESLDMGRVIMAFTPEQFTTGNLRRADGTVVDRSTPLELGMTIDVTVGDYTYPVELPVNTPFHGAQNLNQLAPYAYPEATGDMNAILIPVTWQDQPERANEENLLALKAEVGRVIENGTVTDYSQYIAGGPRFSLSQYFNTASYGKLNISTFVADWFVAPFDYNDYQTVGIEDEAFLEAVYTWLMDTYPNTDWTVYDKDANGYFDALMFVNVGISNDDGYFPMSFAGGAHHLPSYNGSNAGTPEKPAINGFINVNASLLQHNTLIHEFGHNLGLIDYYDITYSGIDAVGSFDMQSLNSGDWNPYSKYAANWIEPTVVDLAPGETKEYTIGAFSNTGDAIVIPVHADTFDGPFNEYIMVDLFTDGGVNTYDVEKHGLVNTHGVRIYHIDARMETHTETVGDVQCSLGTPNKVNAYNADGIYQVELIQAGGDNTFTDLNNLRTLLSQEDLFTAGDSFTLESYSEFFRNGKMDDDSDFPYTIDVVSISQEAAVIRITANS